MKYESRITCFIDILGFQKHINDTIDSDDSDIEAKIKSISNALMLVRDVLDIDKKKNHGSKVVTQFSDCIVISFSINEESGVFYTLLEIQLLLINLVSRGFLCRGGISYGKLIHTEKLVFGPALVEAYKMESEAALYPRVILKKSIIKLGGKNGSYGNTAKYEKKYIKKLLSKDCDGMYYIDFLNKAVEEFDDPYIDFVIYLNKLGNLIKEGLKNKNPSVAVKYQWLKEKYNKVVISYQKDKVKWNDKELEKAYKALPVL